MLSQEEKIKAAGKVMDRLNAKKAKANPNDERPAIYFAGKRPDLLDHGIIKSGNLALDTLLHGGYKRGSLTIFYGPPNCGKTSLALESIANAQKDGLVCAYLHSEAAFPMAHARMLGVDLESLIMIQDFTNGEDAFNMLCSLLTDDKGVPTNIVDLVVVDSIAALVPKYVLDKINDEGLESQEMGSLPKMLTNATRRIFGTGAMGKAALLFINQIRDNLSGYGGGLNMPGGHAVKHFAHVINKFSAPKGEYLYEGTGDKKRRVGHTVKITMEKNKAGLGGHPGQEGEYRVYYNVGTDNVLPLYNAALLADLILNPSSGSFQFNLPKEFLMPLGLWKEETNAKGEIKTDEPLKLRGKDNVLELLRDTDVLRNVLMFIIRDSMDVQAAIAACSPAVGPTEDDSAPDIEDTDAILKQARAMLDEKVAVAG